MKEALSRFKDTVKGEIRKALKVLRNDEDVEEMDTSDSAISAFGICLFVNGNRDHPGWSTIQKHVLHICFTCFVAKIGIWR